MKLRAGEAYYTVRISSAPIHDERGDELWAFCDMRQREIVLSCELPTGQRGQTLRHEYFHLWARHVPIAADEEGQAILFATVSESFDFQLRDQGGIEALETMKSEPHVPQVSAILTGPRMNPATLIRERIECRCGASIGCASVVSGQPKYFTDLHLWGCERAARCGACDRIWVWFEICNETGYTMGQILPAITPRALKPDEVKSYCQTYPDLNLVAC